MAGGRDGRAAAAGEEKDAKKEGRMEMRCPDGVLGGLEVSESNVMTVWTPAKPLNLLSVCEKTDWSTNRCVTALDGKMYPNSADQTFTGDLRVRFEDALNALISVS